MANRHLARSTVLQALYEWDFSDYKIDPEEILKRDKPKQKVDNLCTKQALEMFKRLQNEIVKK